MTGASFARVEVVPVWLFPWLCIEIERATWESLTPGQRVECAAHARRAAVAAIEARRRRGVS